MLTSYLRNISEQKVFDGDGEIEIAREIRKLRDKREQMRLCNSNCSTEALDTRVAVLKHCLIRANLHIVVIIAKRYDMGMVPLADLIQEGNIGLINAADRFDHRLGFQFSTFASSLIRNAIRDALAKHGNVVRIPHRVVTEKVRLQSNINKFKLRNGRTPSDEQLSKLMKVSLRQLRRMQSRSFSRVSATECRDSYGNAQNYTIVLADEGRKHPIESVLLNSWLRKKDQMLETLTPVEKFVVKMRFGLDDGNELTLHQIGSRCDLSKERIRQIQKNALEKLRVAFAGT